MIKYIASTIGLLMMLVVVGWHLPDTTEHQFAANFSTDIEGIADTRPSTWGTAGVSVWEIQMQNVPFGSRVRILRVFGDVVSWTRHASVDKAGVLFGLGTTGPEGGQGLCDLCAINTMLYIQDVINTTSGSTHSFDHVVKAGGLLSPDHKLLVKVAAWLNDTGQPIHIEPTINVVFRYEKETQ